MIEKEKKFVLTEEGKDCLKKAFGETSGEFSFRATKNIAAETRDLLLSIVESSNDDESFYFSDEDIAFTGIALINLLVAYDLEGERDKAGSTRLLKDNLKILFEAVEPDEGDS